MNVSRSIINIGKKILFLKPNDNLSSLFVMKRWNIVFGKYFYRKKYTTTDILECLKILGVIPGDNIFIHSSWDSFYNYQGNVNELLDAIIQYIGPDGTIAMPAYPINSKRIFNVKKTATAAGLIAETFRRTPGVKRSCNVRHSVCAMGPLAEYLIKDHTKSLICFDENSPYYRICEKHFKVILLGMPTYYIGTFQYVCQATTYKKTPYFAQFYDETRLEENHYKNEDGIEKSYPSIYEPNVRSRKNYFWGRHLIKKYINPKKYQHHKISNLNITCIDAHHVNEKLIELAQKNIFLYSYPFAR